MEFQSMPPNRKRLINLLPLLFCLVVTGLDLKADVLPADLPDSMIAELQGLNPEAATQIIETLLEPPQPLRLDPRHPSDPLSIENALKPAWNRLQILAAGDSLKDRPTSLARVTGGYRNVKWSGVYRPAALDSHYTLLRFGIKRSSPGGDLIIGHFGVNSALGWLLASRRPWPMLYGVGLYDRASSSGPYLQSTSEAGRGWLGAAMDLRQPGHILSIWGGLDTFPGRRRNNELIPYSDTSLQSAESLTERHVGVRFQHNFKAKAWVAATVWRSDWNNSFAGALESSRFFDSGDGVTTTGLEFSNRFTSSTRLIGEVGVQENRSTSESVLIRKSIPGLDGSLYLYRADEEFQPLHSRPALLYGSDPRGRTGARLSLSRRIETWVIGGNWGAENLEFNQVTEEEILERSGTYFSQALFVTHNWSGTWSGDLRLSNRIRSEVLKTAVFQAAVLSVVRETTISRTRFRYAFYQAQGAGRTLQLFQRQRLSTHLALEGMAGHVETTGSSASVGVLIPFIPGAYPALTVHGDQVCTSLALFGETSLFGDFWIRVVSCRKIQSQSDSNTEPLQWAVGYQWNTGIDHE